MLRVWIAFTGWTLIVFGAIGLLLLVFQFSLLNLIINCALIGIGVLDLRNLKRANRIPRRAYPQIALTQFLLGLIISVLLTWMGLHFCNSQLFQQFSQQVLQAAGNNPAAQQILHNTCLIVQYGLPIGAAIILLSQVFVCTQLLRRAKAPPKL